jgi:hypothetical protein
MAVCLIAVFAMSAVAFAGTAAEYPAPGGSVVGAPAVVSVDVLGAAALNPKTAVISINGTAKKTFVLQGVAGHWASTQVLVGSVYKTTWLWTADAAGSGKATVYCYTDSTASQAVALTVTDNTGAVTTDSWSFTVAPGTVYNPPPPNPPADTTAANAECANCHTAYGNDVAMGPDCVSCHTGGFEPLHTAITATSPIPGGSGAPGQYAHPALAAKLATNSAACVSCHGSDVKNVGFVLGAQQHTGCSCHTYGEVSLAKTGCQDCHAGDYGATHGWAPNAGKFNGEPAYNASGHNTPTYGTVGAHSKWDGSEGVVVKDSTGTTITQEWALPTADVFWSQRDMSKSDPTTDAAPATANTTVGWNSVITCQDCHTGLNASMGPQGANVGSVGLDPNYSDDWKTAELTSWDPTGMRSIATTMGSANPYYDKSDAYTSSGSLQLVDSLNLATASQLGTAPAGTMVVYVAAGAQFTNIGASNVASRTAFYVKFDKNNPAIVAASRNIAVTTAFNSGSGGTVKTAATPGGISSGYSAGDIAGKFICQKCHKLVNPYQGIAGVNTNGRNNNLNYMGYSNEVHMEHHGNQSGGAGNCISCHIGVPHGWKRPRLLVYGSDPTPYMVPQGGSATTQTVVANGVTYTNAISWAAGTTSTPNATHLYGISAGASAPKEGDDAGLAATYASNDATSGANFSNWNFVIGGTGWAADPGVPSVLGGDPATNPGTATQNNCNACNTGTGTHSPVSTEGIPNTYPKWK